MLDAIKCAGRACYNNDTAISATVAMNSDGVLLKWDGVFWTKLSNSNLLVDTGSSYLHRSTVYRYAKGSSLYYDNCEGGLRKMWESQASKYCISKGMNIPIPTEITAMSGQGVAHGVPACGGGTTWTDKKTSYGTFYDWYVYNLNSLFIEKVYSDTRFFTRCVK